VKQIAIDTNVLVSILLRPPNPPGRIIDRLLVGELQPVFDDRILREYRQMLARPRFRFQEGAVADLMDYFERFGWLLAAPELSIRLADPKSLTFLEVAAASASPLTAGNLCHSPQEAPGLPVIVPSKFLAMDQEDHTM
jgi:predicted nucleic acid-binding protein